MEYRAQIMGMPILLKFASPQPPAVADDIFDYLRGIDARFSTYKPTSEISRINAGLPKSEWSDEMRHVLQLCEQTTQQTGGYFNIEHRGTLDPSGLVKGWAIQGATKRLLARGITDFYVDAGGDIQPHGHNAHGQPWRIGIRNPFNRDEIIKTVAVTTEGVATSGTYIRGQHIYNPLNHGAPLTDVMSLTVIGPNIYDADRFATAAFAMGKSRGIQFIDALPGFEGYMVDSNGTATLTSGFKGYEA